MINSEKYWNHLFEAQEKNDQRANQTTFFINLALENLPKWILEDISDNHMSICDIGCAEGIGTELLATEFKDNRVVGIDFSEQAIAVAQGKYKKGEYQVGDIKHLKEKFDVLFCSNVLEHFSEPAKILKRMIRFAEKYCILLVPFREYYTVPEHFSYFDFQSFPLEMCDEYSLCFYKPMTISEVNHKYWFGEQILVVYAKKQYIESKELTLKHMYNGYVEERTQIIRDFDEKLARVQQEEKAKYAEALARLEKVYQEKMVQTQSCIDAKAEQEKEHYVNVLAEHTERLQEYTKKIFNFDKVVEEILANHKRELSVLESKLEQIEAEKNCLVENHNQELEIYRKRIENISVSQEGIKEAIQYINDTQKSRVYKVALAFRRFYFQFLINGEKREFLKWFAAKLSHKKYDGRALSYFDYLENAKARLRESRSQIICEVLQHKENGFELKRKDLSNTVFIFASVPFYDVGGGQRSAQLAKTFNELGYIVHYIYGFECSEENIPDMFIPAVTHKLIDEVTVDWYKSVLTKGAISIFEIPFAKFKPYLDIAKKYNQPTVYEHIDNWNSNLGNMFYDAETFKQFIEGADLITVTAKMLGEKIEERTDREYLYLPNAVNINIFEPGKAYACPADLKIGKSKTLLYFGSLWGEWFDWEKILYVAEKCKDVSINLIGDYSGIKDKISAMPDNIYFLGLKAQVELPAYLQHSDIALLPFKNCEIGKYVSPLKIFEYIAMNKKVLATGLDDIKGYPNVYASDSCEEWVEILKRDDDIISTEEFIGKNNWYSRCAMLIEHFRVQNEPKKPFISVIILNYNNKKVIERCVKTLFAHNRRYQYEIIVVDNGSSDGSYELLKEKYGTDVILLRNSVNGCSSGRNLGAKYAKGEYIIFLDSDQWIVSDYWLDSAIDLIVNNVNIGAVGWNAGWFEPGKTTGPIVDYLPNRGIASSEIWYKTDIAYLATSGFLMKKSLFDQIGGFDEFYDPTCFEDTDISLKIREYGYELAYCPYMAIMHLPHQTTQSGSAKHTQLMERNGKYFWEKWVGKNAKLLEYYRR